MSLTNKILLLIAFMASITFIVFCWFISQFMNHAAHFHTSFAKEQQALETAFDKSLQKFAKTAEHLQEGVKDHLKKMEEGLHKNREKSENFDEDFLQRQNQIFNEVNSFVEEKEAGETD